MKRKVVKLGPATMVVSLPSRWAKQRGISIGDEIDLEEFGQDLLLKPHATKKLRKKRLDLTKHTNLLNRSVVAEYIKGTDEIEVLLNSPVKARKIQQRAEKLIGLEVIEQDKQRLLLKDLGGVDEENFETVVKRILFLLHTISDETLEAFRSKIITLDYLQNMEDNVNKFAEYGLRLLHKKGHQESKKITFFYCFLFLLEDLGDEYKRLAKTVEEYKITLNPSQIKLFSSINDFYQHLEKLCLKFTHERLLELANEYETIDAQIASALKKARSPKEVMLLKHFEHLLWQMIKISGELLALN